MQNLPKIDVKTYKMKLASEDGKEIEYRPFTTKEQKIFLMTLEDVKGMPSETEDDRKKIEKVIADAMKQVARNCIVTPDVDLSRLPTFDVQNVYFRLREKSVGEKITVELRHTEDGCNELNEIEIDLREIHPVAQEGHTNVVMLTDTVRRQNALSDYRVDRRIGERKVTNGTIVPPYRTMH